MTETQTQNPKDFQVVSFHNSELFGFTPEMGCMYDGRPINGKTGAPGIDAGETVILPYHIGHQLATNLAKISMLKGSGDVQAVDAQGNPMIKAIWDTVKLENLKNSYLKDLYVEDKPIAMSQTDLLMKKVDEYKAMVEKLLPKSEEAEVTKVEVVEQIETQSEVAPSSEKKIYLDKQEVMAELEKRGIKHDKRANKENLEKLLA